MEAFTLPTPAEFINGVGLWASDLFDEFLPLITLEIGLVAAAVCLVFLMVIFEKSIKKLFSPKNKY